jgi:hypothetical protein
MRLMMAAFPVGSIFVSVRIQIEAAGQEVRGSGCRPGSGDPHQDNNQCEERP